MVESETADLTSDLTRIAAIPANLRVVDAALRLVVALARGRPSAAPTASA
jgi:hypothetical protein